MPPGRKAIWEQTISTAVMSAFCVMDRMRLRDAAAAAVADAVFAAADAVLAVAAAVPAAPLFSASAVCGGGRADRMISG